MRSIFIILLLGSFTAKATNYHFSNSGNDNNAGTIAAPLKTLYRINTLALVSGDTISFNRGETFYGAFKINGKTNIAFVAYGTGADPIISGFQTLTGWTATTGGVYKTTCDSCDYNVRMVTVNGSEKGMGRWPNSGYRNTAAFTVNSNVWFRDETLAAQNSIDWTGAFVVQRKRLWIIDIDSITKNVGDTIYYQNLEGSPYHANYYYGWFVQNDLRTVDSMHEWFYNRNTKEMYMYFGGNNPNSYTVKASSIDTLVKLELSNDISFTHITFDGSNESSVLLRRVHRVKFDSCSFTFSGRNGIFGQTVTGSTDSSSYITVSNTSFSNTNNNALELMTSFHHNTISNNTITNSSVIVGMGWSLDNAGQGIVVTGNNGLITKNVVRNTGYVPINWGGDSTKVTKNLIDSFCLNKSDGAGIYSYTGELKNYKNRREVSDNIILNGLGEKASTDLPFRGYESQELAMGIYMDIVNDNVLIKNNTVFNCDHAGVYLLVNRKIRVENNTLYKNGNGIMFNGSAGDSLLNVQAVHNKIILGSSTLARVFNNSLPDIYDASNRLDSNYFALPYGQTGYYQRLAYNIDTFRVKTGFDLHSVKAAKTSTNILFDYNYSDRIKKVWLDGTWYDAAGKAFSNTAYIEPYGSIVLMKINAATKLKGSKITIGRRL